MTEVLTSCVPATGCVLIADAEIDPDAWHEVRRGGIGGSDVAAIAGLSKYTSPYALWMEKRGLVADDEQSEAAYWGTVLESVVADEFAKRTGHLVIPTPGTLQHPKHEWMLVNVDRFICDLEHNHDSRLCVPTAVLECKTTSVYQAQQWEDDELPYAAALQVQHALEVTGLKKAYVPALIGGQRFVVSEVDYDVELASMLIEMESEFWRRVVQDDPPDIDGESSTAQLLNKAFDVEPTSEIGLPDSVRELIAVRQEAQLSIKEAKTRQTEAENRIKVMLGNAEIGTISGVPVVTWKQSQRKGYTVEPTTTRTLVIKKVEQD